MQACALNTLVGRTRVWTDAWPNRLKRHPQRGCNPADQLMCCCKSKMCQDVPSLHPSDSCGSSGVPPTGPLFPSVSFLHESSIKPVESTRCVGSNPSWDGHLQKRAKSAHQTNQPANQPTDRLCQTHDPAWSGPNQQTNQQTNQLTNQPNLTGSQTRRRQLTSNMDAWDTTA